MAYFKGLRSLKNFGADGVLNSSHLPKSKGTAALVAFGIACWLEVSEFMFQEP